MELFRLDFGLAVWTWVTFGGLCFVIARWVLPPLLRNLELRERAIARSVDDAAALEQRLRGLEDERLGVLAQAREQGEALIQDARKQAAEVRQSLLDRAAAEAEAVLAQGRAALADERRAAVDALRDELAEFALSCAGTIVGSALVGEHERAWAREQARRL